MKHKAKKAFRKKGKTIMSVIRFPIITFGIMVMMAVIGIVVTRLVILQNTYITGMSLANNYASEEQGNLMVYETLLSFGTASINNRVAEGESTEELEEWLTVYFQRLDTVLGKGTVDPYLAIDGTILAANPWAGDDSYNAEATEWYRMAVAGRGEVIFTSVYHDVIYNRPVITAAQWCSEAEAVLAFDIFPEKFNFQFNDKLSEKNSFYLCDSTGTIIHKQTSLKRSDEEIQDYLFQLIQNIDNGDVDNYRYYIIDLEGQKRAVYYEKMKNGWISILTVPYSVIFSDYNVLVIIFIGFILLCMAILFVITVRNIRLNSRIEKTNETVRVLGNSYYALYRIDYGKETYEMIKGSDYVRSRIPPSGAYEELLKTAGEVIEQEAYKEFLESFSAQNIRSLVEKRVRDFGGDFQRKFDGVYRWVNVRVLFDESLAPEEVVLCFREVEQEKQHQLQEKKLLKDALEVSRRNEAAKQAFFSNMSHDMRTPLNAIIGLTELAGRNTDDREKTADYLEKINSSSRLLLELINEILDMSRMEQGKVTLDNKVFDLKKSVRDCLDSFRYQAELEKKTMTIEMDHIEDTLLLGDFFRISQILNNLVSNALKFTGEGGTVSVSVSQISSGDFAKFKFVVTDTGIGMSKDYLPHLFEPYSREMRFGEKQTLGTGLGMPITQNLVSQMNGEIFVESELGKGSTFTVILPFSVVEEEKGDAPVQNADKTENVSLAGCHILLAEDNEINMEIATELLSMNGIQVTQAWNGAEALEIFRNSEPFTFDAVLMDMQMPQIDGCEAAKRIRSLNRPDSGEVPIIAVTANAFSEDILATTAAGMDAHISKPIDYTHLCATLSRFIHAPKASGKKQQGAEPGVVKK